MRTPLAAAIIVAGVLAPTSGAQAILEGWESDAKAQAVIALSTVDDVERLPARTVLGEVSLRATAEKTLQNSVEIGFRFEAKAQQDNPARPGFTGNIEPFPLWSDELQNAPMRPQSRGAFSGLTRFGAVEDAGLVGGVETAQVYIDGGYGQISAGFGRGVAARFHEGVPDVFSHVKASSPKLDPGGLNIIRAENDLTGPSAKITYQTPRLLGIRAGLSYTPEANANGVDRDAARSTPNVVSPQIERVVEASAQISRKLTGQNVRLRASASYARGEVSNADLANMSDNVAVWAVGAELEFDSVSMGAEFLSSDNGLSGDGDYSAWSVGFTTEAFNWEWGLRYGESEDENVFAKGKNWSIGAAKEISQNIRIAAGYHLNDVDLGELAYANPFSGDISGQDGVVVEITLSL